MRKVIVIGTLHGGFTDEDELKELILKYKPTQLFTEIKPEDIVTENISKYPSEMQFTYNFAKENNIKVNGMDYDHPDIKFSEEENQEVIAKQGKIIEQMNWKYFNKEENLALIFEEGKDFLKKIQKEEQERNHEMLKLIQNQINNEGTIMIITGAGHLKFFEEHLEEAEFPLRY